MRCLIADDEPFVRAKVAKYLREVGCEVVSEHADGASVLEWLEDNPEAVDALILDVQMPRATGLEVAEALQENYPIVIITGHREFAINAFDQGVVDYLEKPLTLAKVQRGVSRLEEMIALKRYREMTVPAVTLQITRSLRNLVPITLIEGFTVSDRVVHAHLFEDPQEHEVVGFRSLKSVQDAYPREDFQFDGRTRLFRRAK